MSVFHVDDIWLLVSIKTYRLLYKYEGIINCQINIQKKNIKESPFTILSLLISSKQNIVMQNAPDHRSSSSPSRWKIYTYRASFYTPTIIFS